MRGANCFLFTPVIAHVLRHTTRTRRGIRTAVCSTTADCSAEDGADALEMIVVAGGSGPSRRGTSGSATASIRDYED